MAVYRADVCGWVVLNAGAKKEKEKINPLDRLAGRGKMDLDERKTFTKVLIMRYTTKHLILMENRSNE